MLDVPSDPRTADWVHLLVEAARVTGYDRDARLRDGAAPDALLDPDELTALAGRLDAAHASDLLVPGTPGGTVYLCAVDSAGQCVSLSQSNAAGFGAHLTVPETGVFLQNRGVGFSLRPGTGNELAPGRRPWCRARPPDHRRPRWPCSAPWAATRRRRGRTPMGAGRPGRHRFRHLGYQTRRPLAAGGPDRGRRAGRLVRRLVGARPPGRAGGRRRWLRERPGGRVGRRRGRRGRGPTSGYRRGGRLVSFADGLLVAGAGLVAGAVNAVAGGGTLISFPALIAAGNSPLVANITSSVGLVSGYLGGSMAYRSELAGQRDRVRALGLVSVLGGITGAAILLATPSHTFDAVVPWLVLTAALLLFAQPRLAGVVAARRERRPAGASGDRGVGAPAPPPAGHGITTGVHVGVFLSAVYGSYFGAGLGVLLLGVLGILLADGLQRLNALKGVLSLIVNVVGVAIFVFSGRVHWVHAGLLAVTAYAGGHTGVFVARRLSPMVLRYAVVVLGVVVAAVLFVRG